MDFIAMTLIHFIYFSYKAQRVDFGLDDLHEQEVISLLTGITEKIKKENEDLYIKQANIQVTWKSIWLNSNKNNTNVLT